MVLLVVSVECYSRRILGASEVLYCKAIVSVKRLILRQRGQTFSSLVAFLVHENLWPTQAENGREGLHGIESMQDPLDLHYHGSRCGSRSARHLQKRGNSRFHCVSLRESWWSCL